MTPIVGALNLPGRLDGVDVSVFQQGIAYDEVVGAGFCFAVVRCSVGDDGVDRMAAAHLAGFRGAGMIATMVYFAAEPSHGNPRAQVRALWDAVGPTAPDGPLWIDIETRDATLSSGQIVDFVAEAADEAEKLTLLGAGVYSYPDYFHRLQPELGRRAGLGKLPLWSATISGKEPWAPQAGFRPVVPAPWDDWMLHQYSSGAGFRVPGMSCPCDRDLFNGDRAALLRAIGRPAAA